MTNTGKDPDTPAAAPRAGPAAGRMPGRRMLQVPGPTAVPDSVLEATARPTIDHRSPEFAELTRGLLADLPRVFGTAEPVIVYPSSGTGAWEAALVNILSPGDAVLSFETGHFSTLWAEMARELGLEVEVLPGDWRRGVDPGVVEETLAADSGHRIRAVCVVHNETSTGVTSDIPGIRTAMDRAGHPALLLVDTISALGSMEYEHDAWGVDVTVAASQKGLMLPPGLGLNAVSTRARKAAQGARLPRSYWDWQRVLDANADGFYPYTPPTNLLFGLRQSLDLLFAEGLPGVFARHRRHAEATRAATRAWGLEVCCLDPLAHSASVTAILLPKGHEEAEFRRAVRERYGMALGAGLGKLHGRAFRIGHLGDIDDLQLIGALSGVELALGVAGIPHQPGGVAAALEVLRA